LGTNNYQTFNKYIEKWNIDISHMGGVAVINKKYTRPQRKQLIEILTENSFYKSYRLKDRLLKNNLLRYECYICGITEWNNKEITLQLDHINGCNTDNRLENLRLLCPNCHSQNPRLYIMSLNHMELQ
jgi:5-methylcytosine-specific restriction endonuclease McrA